MFGLKNFRKKQEKALQNLKDYELCCLGLNPLSPNEFRKINEKISLNTVQNIGRKYTRTAIDGEHIVWLAPDNREHDLGLLNDFKIMKNYPGFHKARTHALGRDKIKKCGTLLVEQNNRTITIIEMKDGTTGIGLDYKTALRNAALKTSLKNAFKHANKIDAWKEVYGSC